MRSLKVLILLAVIMFSAGSLYAEEKKVDGKAVHEVPTEKGATLAHTAQPEASPVSGSASVAVLNKYIFRGYELSSHSFVVQPSISISYKGFSASLWSNIDSNVNGTQSLTNANYLANNQGKKDINETDLTLSYTYVIDKLSLTGGYIYYGTDYTPETDEIFVTIAYDTLLKPTLSVYRDINEYGGTYFNLSIAHSVPVYKEITLDLGASAGYFAGSDNYWKTYESATGAYTGKKYSGFHDGMVKAGFTIPIAKNVSLQPMVQYWFPLSNKAKKSVAGNSYNPNGKLDDTLVTGINLTLSF
ncbi:MAG: hypothetical protein M1147_11925 [Nitrospirae bacterium]|nr:hypothetical protein [Nitrospirota bacterium]MCL5978799.1 hypothetical protein [Nitrospirota bacterium]